MDDIGLAQRALRGARELIVIDESRNINAAVEAGVEVLRVYDQLTRHDRELLFPDTRAPETFAVARLPRRPSNKAIGYHRGDLIVLDGVHGPGNIGAIVRSAAAFGVAAVIALNARRRDLYRRGTIRAAGPAIFAIPLQTMTLEELVRFCRRNSVTIAATSPRSGTNSALGDERLAIVLGSETGGCSPAVKGVAALQLRVPISERVESLNVSAAAAILAYQRALTSKPLLDDPHRGLLRSDSQP